MVSSDVSATSVRLEPPIRQAMEDRMMDYGIRNLGTAINEALAEWAKAYLPDDFKPIGEKKRGSRT